MSRGSGRLTLHARFGYEYWPAMLVRRRRWLDRASGLRRRRPGGCDMGSLGLTHLISLLLAVAIIAATCGFIASAGVRRNKRRARGFFLLGFFCGLMAGAILPGRRRGLNALGAVARCADVRPLRAGIRRGISPTQFLPARHGHRPNPPRYPGRAYYLRKRSEGKITTKPCAA
jgi:hypothetical protein